MKIMSLWLRIPSCFYPASLNSNLRCSAPSVHGQCWIVVDQFVHHLSTALSLYTVVLYIYRVAIFLPYRSDDNMWVVIPHYHSSFDFIKHLLYYCSELSNETINKCWILSQLKTSITTSSSIGCIKIFWYTIIIFYNITPKLLTLWYGAFNWTGMRI